MKLLQRWLSDLLNLFVYVPEEPERLWPWASIITYVGLMAVILLLARGLL